MDSRTITDIAVKSCEDMHEYIVNCRKKNDRYNTKLISMIVNDVRRVKRKGDYIIVSLAHRIFDTDNLGLHIEGEGDFFEDDIIFDNYDEKSMTVIGYPSDQLNALIDAHEDEDIKIISDMLWLVDTTRECFELHGENLGKIRNPVGFSRTDYEFPKGEKPTNEQRDAVDTILNSKLSYIWGAPGTGKTQFVLATAILAYIRHGKRVAVIAPTNNAVEQVLRGVMKVIKKDDPDHIIVDPKRDILRMGTASAEFLKEYKEICEDRSIISKIRNLKNANENMEEVIYERKIESLKPVFESILFRYNNGYDSLSFNERNAVDNEIMHDWEIIKNIVSLNPELSGYVQEIDKYNLRANIERILHNLMNRSRRVLGIVEYKDKTEDELREIIRFNEAKIKELEPQDSEKRAKSAKLMAMTPYILMGRQSLFQPGGIVSVDHIFIDEVGYSNLIQTMPVFMCGPPVTMLGDHMQLPPVCEIDRDDIISWCTEDNDYCQDGFMKYSFMWDMSALYTESYFFGTIEEATDDYLNLREPRYNETKMVSLRYSHRFANNLARILDKCVYNNNIKGDDKSSLKVMCIDSKSMSAEDRSNQAEADSIKRYIEKAKHLENYIILTPYVNQKKLIAKTCKKGSDGVLTIHGSQGREWDTVIISVTDNRHSSSKIPLRFTGSLPPNTGLKVMNTAVSRAKKKLILVCDYEFWKDLAKQGDLLGMIVADSGTTLWDENKASSREMNEKYGTMNSPKR